MATVPMMLATALATSGGPSVAVRAEPCALPQDAWGIGSAGASSADANDIGIESWGVNWNGQVTDEPALQQFVRIAAAQAKPSRINLYAAAVNCPELQRIAALIAGEGQCTPQRCVVIFGRSPRRIVMPAPPPPPRADGKLPTPKGAPQSWVLNSDYPDADLRARHEGRMSFTLQIDAKGRVTDCVITSSSGHESLDKTTCSLLMKRARFDPAENAAGQKIAGSWASRFTWEATEERSPLQSWTKLVRYRGFPSGRAVDCNTKLFGPVPRTIFNVCGASAPPPWDRNTLGSDPLWIEIRYSHRVDGSPLELPPETGRSVYRRTIRYSIGAAGEVTNCRVTAETGRDVLERSYYDCHAGLDYSTEAVAQMPGASVEFTISVTVAAAP